MGGSGGGLRLAAAAVVVVVGTGLVDEPGMAAVDDLAVVVVGVGSAVVVTVHADTVLAVECAVVVHSHERIVLVDQDVGQHIGLDVARGGGKLEKPKLPLQSVRG